MTRGSLASNGPSQTRLPSTLCHIIICVSMCFPSPACLTGYEVAGLQECPAHSRRYKYPSYRQLSPPSIPPSHDLCIHSSPLHMCLHDAPQRHPMPCSSLCQKCLPTCCQSNSFQEVTSGLLPQRAFSCLGRGLSSCSKCLAYDACQT